MIVSAAAVALAARIACRKLPGPASAVLVTVKIAGARRASSWFRFRIVLRKRFMGRPFGRVLRRPGRRGKANRVKIIQAMTGDSKRLG